MRQAKIYNYSIFAGILTEDEDGYTFRFLQVYKPNYHSIYRNQKGRHKGLRLLAYWDVIF